jgi:hypothetical protein
MPPDPTRHSAAGNPPPDPTGIEQPHDVLAAEEFAMPTREARAVPADPTGIEQPHDVLAAEEFAMPVGETDLQPEPADAGRLIPLAAALALIVLVVALLRRG